MLWPPRVIGRTSAVATPIQNNSGAPIRLAGRSMAASRHDSGEPTTAGYIRSLG
jgi:hypothetical protein